jgi:hypothetical protein
MRSKIGLQALQRPHVGLQKLLIIPRIDAAVRHLDEQTYRRLPRQDTLPHRLQDLLARVPGHADYRNAPEQSRDLLPEQFLLLGLVGRYFSLGSHGRSAPRDLFLIFVFRRIHADRGRFVLVSRGVPTTMIGGAALSAEG